MLFRKTTALLMAALIVAALLGCAVIPCDTDTDCEQKNGGSY